MWRVTCSLEVRLCLLGEKIVWISANLEKSANWLLSSLSLCFFEYELGIITVNA